MMAYGKQTALKGLRKAGDMFGAVDDKVQGAARYVLGERDGKYSGKGNNFQMGAAVLGTAMHSSREQVRNSGSPMWEQNAYLIGTRAAQAGGLTAAGYGLAQLTTQFGGPADEQEPNQLPLD